jgi:hypothetical protein
MIWSFVSMAAPGELRFESRQSTQSRRHSAAGFVEIASQMPALPPDAMRGG